MEVAFFDTSALAKRYLDEKGSAWVIDFLSDEADRVAYIAEITIVELTSAVVRRSKSGSLSSEEAVKLLDVFDRHLVSQYYVLKINSNLINSAKDSVVAHGLRAYDAVQLAAAQDLNREQLENDLPAPFFISADGELLNAARAAGLRAENPNDYP